MRRISFAFITACFFFGFGFSQESEEIQQELTSKPIDSSITWMQENVGNEDNLEIFQNIGLQTLVRSRSTKNDTLIAQVHEAMASWHAYNGLFPPDSVVYHAEKALEYYKRANDLKKIADTYRSLSIDYMNTQQMDKAQEVLFKSISIYEDLEDEAGLGSAYRSLGVLFRVLEDYEKSIEYTQQALPLLKKTENHSSLAIAQFNLIIGYGELGEYQKAYDATETCLEIVRTNAPEEIFVPVRAYSYRGEVYVKAGEYDKALDDYKTAWELCREHIGEERCTTYRTEIGQIYMLQGKPEEALDHLLAGVNAYEDKGRTASFNPI